MATCTASADRIDRPTAPFGATRILAFAATPTFSTMAALNALGGDVQTPICSAPSGAASLTGMTAMYALMAVFHLAPWLRLAMRGRAFPLQPKGRS